MGLNKAVVQISMHYEYDIKGKSYFNNGMVYTQTDQSKPARGGSRILRQETNYSEADPHPPFGGPPPPPPSFFLRNS